MTAELASALAVLLAAILGWAAVLKVGSAAQFNAALAVLLPASLRRPARVVVPAAEFGLAVWLVLGPSARPAGLASAGLFAVFLVAQAALRRAGHSGCGCFGASAGAVPERLEWVRTAVLLVAALAVGAFATTRPGGRVFDAETLAAQLTVALGLALSWYCGVALTMWRRVR